MDTDLITRLAREAGLSICGFVVRGRDHDVHIVELRQFAALVAEEAAKKLDVEVRRLIDEGAVRKTPPYEILASNIRHMFREPSNG